MHTWISNLLPGTAADLVGFSWRLGSVGEMIQLLNLKLSIANAFNYAFLGGKTFVSGAGFNHFFSGTMTSGLRSSVLNRVPRKRRKVYEWCNRNVLGVYFGSIGVWSDWVLSTTSGVDFRSLIFLN